ncbi:MAG: cyclic nucleotide-binding domain-containing protein [Actinomycetota bacterium]
MSDFEYVRWTGDGPHLPDVQRLRYRVLVEEMGKYRSQADHDRRLLSEPEDEASDHLVAFTPDGTLAAVTRMTRGSAGLSDRQIEQYDLQSWLDAGLADVLGVGERLMVAPELRGASITNDLIAHARANLAEEGQIRIVFGAAEPHLIPMYQAVGIVPYASRNINSPEAGYLIPTVSFVPDIEALRGVGPDGVDADGAAVLPPPVQAVAAGSGTTIASGLADAATYRDTITGAVETLAADTIGAFDDFEDDEIDRCLTRSTILSCAAGDRLLKAGGTGRNIFVVLEGTLEARVDDNLVGVITAGDAFGETAFLLETPRSADVFAATDGVQVLSMSDGGMRKLIANDPTVAAKFLRNLSRMLCARLIRSNAAAGAA